MLQVLKDGSFHADTAVLRLRSEGHENDPDHLSVTPTFFVSAAFFIEAF
jgi:hypothetical protein